MLAQICYFVNTLIQNIDKRKISRIATADVIYWLYALFAHAQLNTLELTHHDVLTKLSDRLLDVLLNRL